METVPLVSGSALRPMLDYLERIEPDAWVDVLGFSAATLRDNRPLVPFSLAGQAVARAAQRLGAPDLGLRIADASPVEGIGEFGEMMLSAPTVGGALASAATSGGRFNTGARYWLTTRGEEAWFHRSFARSFELGRAQVSDFGIVVLLKLIGLGAGPGWRPTEIRFEGPPPAHSERLAALARSVRFGQRFTAIVFPREILALPLPPFFARPRTTGERSLEPSLDAATSLRQAVEGLVRLGLATLPAVAEAAGTSVRSLQRRLAASGQSFHGMLDRALCGEACRMLADANRKVIEVSVALGYSDAANFTRAFRRWTGVSPQEFRRGLLDLRARAVVAAAG